MKEISVPLTGFQTPSYGVSRTTLFFSLLNLLRKDSLLTRLPSKIFPKWKWYLFQLWNVIGSIAMTRNVKSGTAVLKDDKQQVIGTFEFDPANSQCETLLLDTSDVLTALLFHLSKNLTGSTGGPKRFLDIGSNWGHYSFLAAGVYDYSVTSFEANPDICANARRAADQLGLGHSVKFESFALSNSTGTTTLSMNTFWSGMASIDQEFLYNRSAPTPFLTKLKKWGVPIGKQFTVEMKMLDDLNLAGVNIVKIDVEGHEMNVLLGATELISREKPLIYFEIDHMNREKRSEMFRYFLNLDYELYFCSFKNNNLLFSQAGLDEVIDTKQTDLLAAPRFYFANDRGVEITGEQ